MFLEERNHPIVEQLRSHQSILTIVELGMRTTNTLERLHEEIKRGTRVARLFPNEASLLRLVSAIEMEISGDWLAKDIWI